MAREGDGPPLDEAALAISAALTPGLDEIEWLAALDLRGVEWAVLSGCDTGLGKIENGEGVLGLRRAFLLAGARTVIMSLWAVEDVTARRWMTSLYRVRGDGDPHADDQNR